MKRKSWKLGSLGLAAMLLLGACSSSSAEEAEGKEYKLKMSVTVNDSSTWYAAAQKLSDDVSEETDGRIKIEIFPNEQLSGGDSGKAVEMLSKGSTDLTFNSTIIYSILDDRFGVASAPFLFNNTDEVDKVFAGEGGEMITKILQEKGVQPLGFGENGFRQVTNSVKEIKSPEDLNGLKIRIPGITMYTDLYRALGADPTTMTFSEVFTSLQQGTINGQENPIDVIHSSKLNEVQDFLTLWNYSYDPLVLGMNKKLYESMSDEDKELFARLGKEAAEYQVELAREKEAKQLEELEAAGMKFYTPTEEELAEFKEAVQPVYEKYTSIWGEDLLKAFQER
ncbi:DctP family TRAP transporter solute-binding subunit [Psychrobacillus lasiicapitis]|uniref:DctP family TRAP transporter solute-binding subunit n=1 Tax=Psychrobacillus lasiicapitis TaxID=1636719 RepID=A0A544T2R8_9BACI|nr:DctP family TRAP transporter solute-binding subunit [Psychrobacillus lasiicapitis]TQR11711.1 DctP family TRAP transporter solute-binding subunit [Psychrobacillus lasiicapitis]GGA18879.1 C4-dicarboxylate ABC transporter [Psychrobacillus lasiicapitis]